MGFGSYFRDLRIEKQITQKQIADVIKKRRVGTGRFRL